MDLLGAYVSDAEGSQSEEDVPKPSLAPQTHDSGEFAADALCSERLSVVDMRLETIVLLVELTFAPEEPRMFELHRHIPFRLPADTGFGLRKAASNGLGEQVKADGILDVLPAPKTRTKKPVHFRIPINVAPESDDEEVRLQKTLIYIMHCERASKSSSDSV